MGNIDKYINKIINDDCLNILKQLPDKSIDTIICDLPYGTTACSWDNIIPFDELWEQYKRIRKEHTPIVLFAGEPFTSKLICSNIKEFKHKWVWNKKITGNFANANKMPLKIDEDICVFGSGKINYYPIMQKGLLRKKGGSKKQSEITGTLKSKISYNDDYYPTNILEFSNADRNNRFHPTQKPVDLIQYLVKTYSNENDIVLDNCSGSGTLAIACHRLNRRFICVEKDKDYYNASVERLNIEQAQLRLF